MDLFNRVFYYKDGVAPESSTSILPADANAEKSRTDYSLRYIKTVLAGPKHSGRTSFLFEVAFQYAEKGHTVLFISPTKITRLPLMLNGCEYPSVEVLKRIQMIHLATKKEYLEFMASVHVKQRDPVQLIIVDDVDFYYRQAEKQNELAVLARIYAFLHDAAAFLSQLRNDTKNEFPSCSVLCSMLTAKETGLQIPHKSTLNMWFNDFITLKKDQIDNSFVMLIKEEVPNGKMNDHSLRYVIKDQKIELYNQ